MESDSLRFKRVEPTFIVVAALDKLAEDRDNMAALTAGSGWQNQLIAKANESNPPLDFSKLRGDILQYPDQPTPEKQPINKLYFEQHGSLVCNFLKFSGERTDDFEVNSLSVRIFESGAIGACCLMKPQQHDKGYDTDSAVRIMREGRYLARKLLFEAIQAFIPYWNQLCSYCNLSPFRGIREFLLFENYEYVDFELIDVRHFDTDQLMNEESIVYLRQLVGFCRMAKPYAWPNYSMRFLRNFMENDVSGRGDELWLASPERFLRYFPNKDVPETVAYASDIVLALEVLLALRAVYKSLLEDIHLRLAKLPKDFSEIGGKKEGKSELGRLQKELAITTFRLSKSRFPPDIQFYAGSAFASRMLRHIEHVLDLDKLANCLHTELDKLKNVIDSFSSLASHQQNISLQYRVLWLTIAIGLAGASIALVQLLTSLVPLAPK